MGKRSFDRFCRMRELVELGKIRRAKRKKPRAADCISHDLPALHGSQRTRYWAQWIKNLLDDQQII
jgi:hypothetical protein